ncbi:uncharacterized protein ASCRUDRAFT_77406 [Ascoidea rubescens DSM 1968]|uniref:Uncharacterized protein n=1 Tax=Ascoidea rubescens DSM 1968 TaxID=1344418 RepID=A0A1D2VBI3_9ASCO|nr:hypothetical protein ASCRUDRAFT_77406 [Ascoidea rubescens DSM 1968]ODV58986.1 hypothetical protein ASCRUDRAFT_77406 [Ascoidea rubescens DSM 1968]
MLGSSASNPPPPPADSYMLFDVTCPRTIALSVPSSRYKFQQFLTNPLLPLLIAN